MTEPKRALIMAGGTGGHVFPALAVATGLRARGWHIDWMGTDRGIEATIVPDNDIALHTLTVRGFRGKGPLARLQAIFGLLGALTSAIGIVRRLRPAVVLGMGGYAAGPGGIAAFVLGRPLVIHEQNAVAGTTNRLLAPFAKRILCGLAGAFDNANKTEVVGNPVRSPIIALYDQSKVYPDTFSNARPMRLLVLGGSLGAMPLNTGVPAALALLSQTLLQRVTVRHQCGKPHVDATEAAYAAAGCNREVKSFIEDMAEQYQWADLVICRAGALTVSELSVAGCPSILVPLPHAIDDHQSRNAESLSLRDAARLLPQKAMAPETLADALQSYLDSPAALNSMMAAAKACAKPRATDRLISILEEVADA